MTQLLSGCSADTELADIEDQYVEFVEDRDTQLPLYYVGVGICMKLGRQLEAIILLFKVLPTCFMWT